MTEVSSHAESHDHLVAQLWEASTNEPMNKLLKGEISFQEYASELDRAELAKTFQLEDRDLRCIDERTAGGLHMAGAGMLQNMDSLVEDLRAAQITGVYSHKACGAAGLYTTREGLDPSQTETYAMQRAQAIASFVGVPYKGHLDVEPSIHNARAAYYTGVDFDPARCDALPKGFVISRNYYADPEVAAGELALAPQIAMGDHGFGSKFSTEEPFFIVAVAADDDQADMLRDEMNRMVEQLPEGIRPRVRLDILIKPEAVEQVA